MAFFDPLSAVLGAVAGAVAVAVVFEAMGRGRDKPVETGKLTSAWRLSELGAPLVVARDVAVEVPAGAKVVASGVVDPVALRDAEVRQAPPVRAEFALDPKARRALLFTGGLAGGTLALMTVDPDVVARLENEFRTLWDRADPYVERLAIRELTGRAGAVIETHGRVAETLPYKDRFMLRLEDGGDIIGVIVPKDPGELRHEDVVVKGRLVRDRTGYAVIEALDIRRIR